ncbi:DUF2842 domain-containing protein [uncultured Sphingomonas sp.]|uniref:DUF2842 domain-containing protein n=1 Tax=uncultured Sphingomonas sp. TaxID=158754 RepID=UPI0035C97C3D
MTPTLRKPVGALAIIGLIIVWAVIIASLSSIVGGWHWVAQLAFYTVAGVVWILPLKPLLLWMETGRLR